MTIHVGARVVLDVGARVRRGEIVGEGPTYFDIECTDGESPKGYRVPRHAVQEAA